MFCRNCGNPMNDNERVCSRCGALRSDVQGAPRTCRVCGNPIQDGAALCSRCGSGAGAPAGYGAQNVPATGGKSKIVAGLLGILLGTFGVHNFYLGYTKKAVLQVALCWGGWIGAIIFYILGTVLSFTVVALLLYIPALLLMFAPVAISIWTLIEGIMILCGKINVDGKGNPLVD